DFRNIDVAVVPVGPPIATQYQLRRIHRAAIEERNFLRVRWIGEIKYRNSTLIPTLNHYVATGHRNERAVVRDAVLLFGLSDGELVVTGGSKAVARSSEDCIGAPSRLVRCATTRRHAAAPFVAVQDRCACAV